MLRTRRVPKKNAPTATRKSGRTSPDRLDSTHQFGVVRVGELTEVRVTLGRRRRAEPFENGRGWVG